MRALAYTQVPSGMWLSTQGCRRTCAQRGCCADADRRKPIVCACWQRTVLEGNWEEVMKCVTYFLVSSCVRGNGKAEVLSAAGRADSTATKAVGGESGVAFLPTAGAGPARSNRRDKTRQGAWRYAKGCARRAWQFSGFNLTRSVPLSEVLQPSGFLELEPANVRCTTNYIPTASYAHRST